MAMTPNEGKERNKNMNDNHASSNGNGNGHHFAVTVGGRIVRTYHHLGHAVRKQEALDKSGRPVEGQTAIIDLDFNHIISLGW